MAISNKMSGPYNTVPLVEFVDPRRASDDGAKERNFFDIVDMRAVGCAIVIALLLAWAIVATVFAAGDPGSKNAGPVLHCKPRPTDRAYAFAGDRVGVISGQIVTSVGDYQMPSGLTCVVAAAQSGRIYRKCPADANFSVWVDLSAELGIVATENGLLGIAIDRRGYLYTDFTTTTATPASVSRGNLCNRTVFEPPSPAFWQTLPVVATGILNRYDIDTADNVDISSAFSLLRTNRRSNQHQGYDSLRLTKRNGRDYLLITYGEDDAQFSSGRLRKVNATTMYGKVFMMDIAATVADGEMFDAIDLFGDLSPARQQSIEMIMAGLRNVGGMSISRNLIGDRTTMSFVHQGNDGGDGAYMVHYPVDEAPMPLDAGWPDTMSGMITTERLFQVAQQCPGFVSNTTTFYPGSSRSYVAIRSDKLISMHDIIYRPYMYNGEDLAVNANYAQPLVGFCGPLLSSAFTYGGGAHNECPVVVNTCQSLAGVYLGIDFSNVDYSLLASHGISARIPKFIVSTPNYRNTQMWTRQNLINIHDVVLPYINNATIMTTTATQSSADQSGFYFATFRADGGYSEIYYAELVQA